MPVSFEKITVGHGYDRPNLAKIWGYKGFQAISKGVVTPRKTPFIILFITKVKQSFLTQYQDSFEDGVLEMEGETDHRSDQRIVNANAKVDEIHLFFREIHHTPFIYKGRVFLTDYTLFPDKPSHFRLVTDPLLSSIAEALEAESLAHGVSLEEFVSDPEGRKRIVESIQYERSRKNRKKAIEIHGNKCAVCGFDFDSFYGAEWAKGYIEVHHTQSITKAKGSPLNIETDLAPVCSNCHSMLHKRRSEVLSIEGLRARIEQVRQSRGRSVQE